MGTYIELLLKAEIKTNLPADAKAVLQYLFNDSVKSTTLPGHEFFTLPKWELIGSCSSYYHIPWCDSKYFEANS